MAEHDNVHRNQSQHKNAAATSQTETGRLSNGLGPEEGTQEYVEGPFGENLKAGQVGQIQPRRTAEDDSSRGADPRRTPDAVKSPNSPADEGL